MSDFVRKALRELSGNHFKLWIACVAYRQSLTLEQFSEYCDLDLATVKRLLRTQEIIDKSKDADKAGPSIINEQYISRDDSKRPHRYALASQLSLRFEDAEPKSQNTTFNNKRESQNAPLAGAKVAFCDGLYLEPLTGIESIIDTESDRSPESRKMPLSAVKWQPDNKAAWRDSNETHARQSCNCVGDKQNSYWWHVKMWDHVRRTDAIHKTKLEAEIVDLAMTLKTEREATGRKQGGAFNVRVNKILTRAGFPIGKKEINHDREVLAVESQPELTLDAGTGTEAGHEARRLSQG